MAYEDDWTGEFVRKALMRHQVVEAVAQLGPNLLQVSRHFDHPTVDVLTVDIAWLDAAVIDDLINDFASVSGIVNVRRDARYSGAAKERALQRGVGLFSMKELMGAAGAMDFAGYERSSMEYVKRVVPQHSNVRVVRQIDQEQLLAIRQDMSEVRFVAADIYILGVADVRDLLTNFPDIDAIVKTNPNGEYSDEANEAASSAGVGLFTFREFMGALNFNGQRFLEYGS